MLPTIAEGENFAMRPLPRGWLHCAIWRRPDLSRVEGARLAARTAELMERFVVEYSGLVFDVHRAAPVWGPATDASIGGVFALWEARGKPVFVVHGPEAIQEIGLRRMIASSAPRSGRLFDSFGAAIAEIERLHVNASGPRSQRGR